MDLGSGGEVAATDDVGGVQYQRVKITSGTADSTTHLQVHTVDAAAGTPTGLVNLAVRRDADTSLVGASGDYSPLLVNAIGAVKVEIFDGGDSHTVDGTVTADAGSGTFTIAGAITNAGTFVVQEDGAALTALQLIDDPVAVLGTATYIEGTTKGNVVGVVRNDVLAALANTDNEVAPLQVNASGALYIQEGAALDVSAATVTVDGSGVTQPVSGTITANAGTGTFTVTGAVTNAGTFATQIDGSALTALQLIDDPVATDDTTTHATGTTKVMGIGAVAAPTDGTVDANDIGMPAMSTARRLLTDAQIVGQDADITIADGGNTITIDGTVTANAGTGTLSVDLGANNDVTTTGNVAHDAVDSGAPSKIGAKATNSIEGLTQVAADDRTDVRADLNGVLITRPHTTLEEIISEHVTNTNGTSTAFSNFAAGGAGVHNYVTTISIYNSSATDGYVDFRDGTAGSIIFTAPAPTVGGSVINLPVPLKGAANTALAFDVSGALSTVHISVVGFQAQG